MSQKPWQGRFSEPTDRAVERFTASIRVDRRLYAHDIAGSIAHCRMLAHTGIIAAAEADTLVRGLATVRGEIEAGTFVYDDALEDIHMHVEARLFELVGAVAHKLHTARSRNDQIALDLRLYLRAAIDRSVDRLHGLRTVLVDLAERDTDVVLPGYTHLQRAQPVALGHHWLAYYEMFSRDAERFAETRRRTDVMPLGSAALAGTPHPIDRDIVARELGFAQVSANSLDSVSDRDFIVEFLAHASLAMVHLSRLCEEVILWASAEFAFITLPDAFATGSSIMPQKKNPDVAELTRGKTGHVFGALIGMLTILKALPLAYNRDLQEDKGPLFTAVDTLDACLDIIGRMLPELRVNAAVMRQAASRGYLNATDLADYLAERGLPFRQAHGCAGRAVAYALEQNKELDELTLAELRRFADRIEADVYGCLQPDRVVDRRRSAGGTARDNVRAAARAARERLAADGTRIQGR